MLNSFLVRNFRLFREFQVPKLSRINLFVGKNNSGKSCLLEALQIYATRAMPTTLADLVFSRDGYWEQLISQKKELIIQDGEDPLRYLFYGYHLPELDADGIEIGPIDNIRIQIQPRAFTITEDEDGTRRRILLKKEEISTEVLNVQTGLALLEDNRMFYLLPIPYDYRESRFYRKNLYDAFKDKMVNVQIVPTRNMTDSKVSSLWDNINLTDLQNNLIAGLRIIEPKIVGIALVGESDSRNTNRVPIVRCDGSDERISLKTMGDGLTRLFHIILALVNARDGFLLIDEFENGLHWSIHSIIWKTIFEVSKKLNVQVFATTHSQDCVRGFYRIWKNKEKEGTFYRLEIDDKMGAKAINYNSVTLYDAIETDVEVR
jgi:AAA15 family ATPase/GTPase